MALNLKFWKKDNKAEERALVWDYLDTHPKATCAEMADELGIKANTIKAHKRNWLRAQDKNSTETAKKKQEEPTTTPKNDKIEEARVEVELLKIEKERDKLKAEVEAGKKEVADAVKEVKLEAKIERMEDKLERLEKDIKDRKAELEEWEDDIEDARAEAERLNIALENDGDEADGPFKQFLEGMFNGQQQQAQQTIIVPPAPHPPTPIKSPPEPPETPETASQQTLLTPEQEADEVLKRMTPEQKQQSLNAPKAMVKKYALSQGLREEVFEIAYKKLKAGAK